MIKILIVDDEPLHRQTLQETIESAVHVDLITCAENGQIAIDQAVKVQPQLIFMDIEMPVMNGIDASAIIKKQLPSCRIVFLTAYDRFEYAVGALRAGGEEYLLKPCRQDEIISCLKQTFGELESAPSENDPFHDAVEVYVRHHHMEDISMKSVSHSLGLSPFYFSRLFKTSFQCSFPEYLTSYRMQRAADILCGTDIPIRCVGEMVGYSDSNYFSKVFKRTLGATPSAFRQMQTRSS